MRVVAIMVLLAATTGCAALFPEWAARREAEERAEWNQQALENQERARRWAELPCGQQCVILSRVCRDRAHESIDHWRRNEQFSAALYATSARLPDFERQRREEHIDSEARQDLAQASNECSERREECLGTCSARAEAAREAAPVYSPPPAVEAQGDPP